MKDKIAIAALALAFSAAACAGDQAALEAADADKDGAISAQEAEAVPGLTEQWAVVDINQDGMVDAAEFAQFEPTSQ
jgi:protein involved in sex pheromone biosynthesis